MTKVRLILGGTFDPIHMGHIHMASLAAEVTHNIVEFMPCAKPIHKKPALASIEHRLAMLKLALNGTNWIINPLELKYTEPRPTITTLQELKQDKVIFIIGSDSLASLDTWHQWQELSKYLHFIVINRCAIEINPKIHDYFTFTNSIEAINSAKSGAILMLNNPVMDISSTAIREDQDALVHPDVLSYMEKHRLYQ